MDAGTDFKSRPPSRYLMEGAEQAPDRSCLHAMNGGARPGLGSREHIAEVSELTFKRTPYRADSKPGGRYVAKDMVELDGIPLLMKTLPGYGYLHGECMTVTGRTIAENMTSVNNPDQYVVCPAEKQSYADA